MATGEIEIKLTIKKSFNHSFMLPVLWLLLKIGFPVKWFISAEYVRKPYD